MKADDIFRKLDSIAKSVAEVQVTTARLEVDLRHHIEGTIANRTAIALLQEKLQILKDEALGRAATELERAKFISRIGWSIGLLSTSIGAFYTLSRIFGFLA